MVCPAGFFIGSDSHVKRTALAKPTARATGCIEKDVRAKEKLPSCANMKAA
jgi:hypothetical protein